MLSRNPRADATTASRETDTYGEAPRSMRLIAECDKPEASATAD
jgi:hypothetical protein